MEPVDRAALALLGQPGRFELLELETLAQQMLGQGVPAVGRVAAAELLRGRPSKLRSVR